MRIKQFLKEMYKLYKPFRLAALGLFLLIMASQLLQLVNPYIYGLIIDKLVTREPIIEAIKLVGLSLALAFLSDVVVNFFMDRLETKSLEYDIGGHIEIKTLDKLMQFSIGQHINENSGIKKSVIDKGEHSLTTLFFVLVYELIPTAIQVLVSLAALFIFAPQIGAIVLTGVAIFTAISLGVNFLFKKEFDKMNDMHDDNQKLSQEILRNISLVKISAREEKTTQEYMDNLTKFYSFSKQTWLRFILYVYGRNIFMVITRAAALLAGIWYVYQGVYTPGYLIIVLSWSSNAFGRLQNVSNLHRRLIQIYSAIKKYFTLMNVEPDIKQAESPVVLEQIEGRIEIRNLNFKYPHRQYIEEEKGKGKSKKKDEFSLRDINLSIEPGKTVAIVGPSGAGKSTIMQLLIRAFDPTSGKILIDGHDLRDVDLKSLREAIGMVPQDVSLFDNTLRYNMVFGLNGYGHQVKDNQLHDAAQLSCIDGFYSRLEKGFDTIIGERGIKLSGGERQRVGIARALMKNPSFLMFDEATSHLDTENETMIRKSMQKVAMGRTSIIIAHRLSTIRDADQIVVMDQGQIVGQGTHDELMSSCHTYQRLINNQTVMVG